MNGERCCNGDVRMSKAAAGGTRSRAWPATSTSRPRNDAETSQAPCGVLGRQAGLSQLRTRSFMANQEIYCPVCQKQTLHIKVPAPLHLQAGCSIETEGEQRE